MVRLERARERLKQNHERRERARSSEFADVVSEWIRRDEEKAGDMERSLDELDAKIRDAQARLEDD